MNEHAAGYNDILKTNFERLCAATKETAIKLGGSIKESGKEPHFDIIVNLPWKMRDHFADKLEESPLKIRAFFRQNTVTHDDMTGFTIPLRGNTNKKIADMAELIKNTLEHFGKPVPELIANFSQGNFGPVAGEVKSRVKGNGSERGDFGI